MHPRIEKLARRARRDSNANRASERTCVIMADSLLSDEDMEQERVCTRVDPFDGISRLDALPARQGVYVNVRLAVDPPPSTQHQYPTPGTSAKLLSGVPLM
jgi:hypothetical protein